MNISDIWVEEESKSWGFISEKESNYFWDNFNIEDNPNFELLDEVKNTVSSKIEWKLKKKVKVTEIDSDNQPGEFEYV